MAKNVNKSEQNQHELKFLGGVLSCSCGWRSNTAFFKLSDVQKASEKHLESVKAKNFQMV